MAVIVLRLLCCRHRVLRRRGFPLLLAKKAVMAVRPGAHGCTCCGIGLLPLVALCGPSGGGIGAVVGGEMCCVPAIGSLCLGTKEIRPLAAPRPVPAVAPAN